MVSLVGRRKKMNNIHFPALPCRRDSQLFCLHGKGVDARAWPMLRTFMNATPASVTKTSCIPSCHLSPKFISIYLRHSKMIRLSCGLSLAWESRRGRDKALFIPACMRAEQGFQIDEAFCILIGCPIISMKCCAACGNVEDEKLPRG